MLPVLNKMILINLKSIFDQEENGLNIIKMLNYISSPSSYSITNILFYILLYSINNLICNNLILTDQRSSSVETQTDYNLMIKYSFKNVNIFTFLLLFININLIDLTERINYCLVVLSFILNIKTVKKYFDTITNNLQVCISNYGKCLC
jgi:hypothetical protein